MRYEQLQEVYAGPEYYWGTEPNGFAARALGFLEEVREGLRAVDLGAGEGRDAVLFAEHGLETLAVDISPNGLQKAERLARERGVRIDTRQGDVNSLQLGGRFDLVYSIGTVQYIEPEKRSERFGYLKERTVPGGINALLTFVDHPDVAPAPDWGDNEYLYVPGELAGYYEGWECLHSRGFVFDDDSGGQAHQHAMEEYVFQKPETAG
ncbi:SAM-dependent methyltransferase [Rubrobacter aplysinae]|uniref:SAM-dependent methyltransferase n=1 Tax=Rubrobacter aplysinae TaxID=909625 RepID=UPI00064B8BDE|nr:methyltransferase domain-containing protein [Rubrobacter aplysinae]